MNRRAKPASEGIGIYAFRPNQPTVWFHSSARKSNHWCLYCARYLADEEVPSDREHLIGRKFVPDGSLDGGKAFNLIFRACKTCNAEKADVERHISSVTLFNSLGRDDPAIDDIADRKASKDYHPIKKGKLVKDASSETSVGFTGPGIAMRFGLLGPPQLDPGMVKLLALRHVQGLFSLVTSKDPKLKDGTRLLPASQWFFAEAFPHSDWGNPWIIELAKRVQSWTAPALVHTANGYFKAILRRGPKPEAPWFWALEWNKSYRVVGAIGKAGETPAILGELPPLEWKRLDETTRYREEHPLDSESDLLFRVVRE